MKWYETKAPGDIISKTNEIMKERQKLIWIENEIT